MWTDEFRITGRWPCHAGRCEVSEADGVGNSVGIDCAGDIVCRRQANDILPSFAAPNRCRPARLERLLTPS